MGHCGTVNDEGACSWKSRSFPGKAVQTSLLPFLSQEANLEPTALRIGCSDKMHVAIQGGIFAMKVPRLEDLLIDG